MSKKILFFFLFFLFLFPLYTAAQEPEAEDITSQISLPSNLTDRDLSTAVSDAAIQIHSPVPVRGVYLVWNQVPETLSLQFGEGSAVTYSSGFLHQYLTVNNLEDFSLFWEDKNAALAEIYIFSEGKLPGWVQVWKEPCSKADLLLLPAHADDEHLFFGGTIPVYAGQRGLAVQVAYMTFHTKDRWHELLDGLWTAGDTHYPVIPPFKDLYCETYEQAQNLYDEDAILEYYVELIRKFKPEAVIGHDLNGEYGHGAHMLSARMLAKALERSGDASFFPDSYADYGGWNVKKCYLHLYEKNKVVLLWDEPLSAFGGKTGAEVAKESYAKHVSQQGFFKFSVTGGMGCAYFGLYRSIVGSDDVGNDFLENIPAEDLTTYVPVVVEGTEPEKTTETEKPPTEMNSPTEKAYDHIAYEVEIDRTEVFVMIAVLFFSALITGIIMFIMKKRNR